jgi:hypothetical protein|tara:strand:+ start:270 stop:563 length:294 start_codon:yes stop_codon:yes gene_type:complete
MTIKRTTLDLTKTLKSEFITQDDKTIYHTAQNVRPVIEHARALRELEPGKTFRHAAEIPKVIWNKALREGWHNDPKAWKRWLNDPDNKAFRVWQGRI